jgi:hypothetical protein
MSFSAYNALLGSEIPTPPELEVSPLHRRLAEHLKMKPQEVKFLLSRAEEEADNFIVGHAWGKLLSVIKLRDNDTLQAYLVQVEEIRDIHLERLAKQQRALEVAGEMHMAGVAERNRQVHNQWDVTNRDYGRFEERLIRGVFVGDIKPEEEALLKELTRLYENLTFIKFMGWRGRKVRLDGKLPDLDMDEPWYPLARALVKG